MGVVVLMGSGHLARSLRALVGLLLVFTLLPFSAGLTNLRDVMALNNLYVALGYPPLEGWLLVGGDPCGDEWQGVECVFENITALNLTNANLGGELGDTWDFPSILSIDLTDNHIGGRIPSSLPRTLIQLSLSNNSLTGEIPDAFQPLSTLIDVHLADNNLSGPLPSSFGNLTALNILHMQNNKLTGLLDVIADLPFTDLNIEHNLFSGPIPEKLLTVPNFKKDGNPFNTTVLPSPPAPSPDVADEPSPSWGSPAPTGLPWKHAGGPFPGSPNSLNSSRNSGAKKVLVVAGLGVLALVLVGGLLCLCIRRCTKEEQVGKSSRMYEESAKHNESFPRPDNRLEKVGPREVIENPWSQGRTNDRKTALDPKSDEHKINIQGMGLGLAANPPPGPRRTALAAEKVATNPIASGGSSLRLPPAGRVDPANSIACYDIASLQLFTNSFSQENFIGEGTLGSVYKGILPNKKLVAIKKLDTTATRGQSDEEFRRLVSHVSKLQHQNIVELVGYCCEHGERLFAYSFCQSGTLHDALHIDEHRSKKLSWELRTRIALGAAKALEYLHEKCHPPVVHRNFKSENVLLNDDFEAQVSDCGLAPLLTSSNQSSDLSLAAKGYAAPELETGSYTWQSDVYSFGVVMLELLTGRRPYERARPRGTQHLARWAISRLHDIDALSKMVDPSLNGHYPAKSLSRFADIVSRCIQREPEFRPLMSEVVQDLMHVV